MITRARGSLLFPAQFQLIAAMNPCPCGRLGVRGVTCECSPGAIQSYLRKLSQPILDRIDLHVEMEAVPLSVLSVSLSSDDSTDEELCRIDRVARAVHLQKETRRCLNAQLSGTALREAVRLQKDSVSLLERAAEKLGLSARSFTRVLRVARTIADLEGQGEVRTEHIAEAIGYRSLERYSQYFSGKGSEGKMRHRTAY